MGKIQALAYVVAESTDISKWKAFAEGVLGAMTGDAPDGGLFVKLDEREYRIVVVRGREDRYVASGWEVANAQDFEEVLGALRRAGLVVSLSSVGARDARRVRGLAGFTDPSGNRHEISYGYYGKNTPFVSPAGVEGFKTGIYGVGHTVLPSMKFDASLKFFQEVLGFGLSDTFNFKPAPEAPAMRIYFLHTVNGRHHSLALAEMPSPSGCVHLMVEVNSMTDVGKAHDRMVQSGTKLMATMGQHENDRMTSFYMLTPSNFAIEYGWGGLILDPAQHQATETQRVSIWGHDFSVGFR